MLKRFFAGIIETEVTKRVNLAVRALDDTRDRSYSARGANTYPRDRRGYDRDEVLADALEAWRVNPLARRVVGMMTQYVVGGGVGVGSPHKGTNKFLSEWWSHSLNKMDIRMYEWCDELGRAGELFIVVSTDLAGMSYMRAIPAAEIQDIETADNDLEQELFIVEKPAFKPAKASSPTGRRTNDEGRISIEGRRWQVYNPEQDFRNEDGAWNPVMLHYAVNRPVGAKFGESDLSPVLRWLARYASWLEDRARLNRFRNTFVFWVKAKFTNQAEKLQRQADLNRDPPNPGSILVTDESETWSGVSPNLASFEAAEDGLSLKKMVAAGTGIPMHFLAEPEGATRTTAESAGGPTFRHFQQRQVFFLWMLEDLARVALARRKVTDRTVNPKAEIKVTGTDISSRDNAALAAASSTVVGAFAALRDRGLIDDNELLRIAYRFAGEVVDLEDLLKRGSRAPKPETANDANKSESGPGRPGGIELDPITG